MIEFGTGGRTRTDTHFRARDFESLVYTNFTTPACVFLSNSSVFFELTSQKSNLITQGV